MGVHARRVPRLVHRRADDPHGDVSPPVGHRRRRLDNLQRRHREPLTEGDVGQRDGAPLLERPEQTSQLARQLDPRALPEPELPQPGVHSFATEVDPDLRGADVRGELEDVADGEHAVLMVGVSDGSIVGVTTLSMLL